MARTDPRPSGRRIYGSDFVSKATELGFENGRQAWRTIVQAVKKASFSAAAAFDEYVTRGQLAELLQDGPGQVSQEKWQLIVQVSKRLLRVVTREELYQFGDTVGATRKAAGSVWNLFMRNMSRLGELPPGVLTTDEVDLKYLEAFCKLTEDENNWPANYGPVHDSLLRRWLASITQ